MPIIWNNDWYTEPMIESDYLDMAAYIYRYYDHIVREMPQGSLNKLKNFIDTGNCSDLDYVRFLNRSDLMSDKEVCRRIYHWLTASVIPEQQPEDQS